MQLLQQRSRRGTSGGRLKGLEVSDGVHCIWQEEGQLTDFNMPRNKYLPGAEAMPSVTCESMNLSLTIVTQVLLTWPTFDK